MQSSELMDFFVITIVELENVDSLNISFSIFTVCPRSLAHFSYCNQFIKLDTIFGTHSMRSNAIKNGCIRHFGQTLFYVQEVLSIFV